MRTITKFALSLTMLATQANVPQFNFGNIAAAAQQTTSATAGVYEVKLNTNTASPVVIAGQTQPDYDRDVLVPLHAAQAAAAAKAAQAAAAAAAQQAAVAARAAAKKAATRVAVVAAPIAGSHADWMREAGIAEADFGYVDYIVSHESGWGVTKSNYGGSGAYGLGQALPASKMARFGADYLTDPVTQLKWANAYAVGSYGSWANAYAHWTLHHNW